ncbi:unnamed protein product [Amoebophrya sp. A25]|nr:unnamed protein product [Amoebophrya sp. A25]|eukprot:GSA25T00012463001.1
MLNLWRRGPKVYDCLINTFEPDPYPRWEKKVGLNSFENYAEVLRVREQIRESERELKSAYFETYVERIFTKIQNYRRPLEAQQMRVVEMNQQEAKEENIKGATSSTTTYPVVRRTVNFAHRIACNDFEYLTGIPVEQLSVASNPGYLHLPMHLTKLFPWHLLVRLAAQHCRAAQADLSERARFYQTVSFPSQEAKKEHFSREKERAEAMLKYIFATTTYHGAYSDFVRGIKDHYPLDHLLGSDNRVSLSARKLAHARWDSSIAVLQQLLAQRKNWFHFRWRSDINVTEVDMLYRKPLQLLEGGARATSSNVNTSSSARGATLEGQATTSSTSATTSIAREEFGGRSSSSSSSSSKKRKTSQQQERTETGTTTRRNKEVLPGGGTTESTYSISTRTRAKRKLVYATGKIFYATVADPLDVAFDWIPELVDTDPYVRSADFMKRAKVASPPSSTSAAQGVQLQKKWLEVDEVQVANVRERNANVMDGGRFRETRSRIALQQFGLIPGSNANSGLSLLKREEDTEIIPISHLEGGEEAHHDAGEVDRSSRGSMSTEEDLHAADGISRGASPSSSLGRGHVDDKHDEDEEDVWWRRFLKPGMSRQQVAQEITESLEGAKAEEDRGDGSTFFSTRSSCSWPPAKGNEKDVEKDLADEEEGRKTSFEGDFMSCDEEAEDEEEKRLSTGSAGSLRRSRRTTTTAPSASSSSSSCASRGPFLIPLPHFRFVEREKRERAAVLNDQLLMQSEHMRTASVYEAFSTSVRLAENRLSTAEINKLVLEDPKDISPGDDCMICLGPLTEPPFNSAVADERGTPATEKANSPATKLRHQHHIKDKVAIVKLPQCGHMLHLTCALEWLHSRQTCPYCRATVVVS